MPVGHAVTATSDGGPADAVGAGSVGRRSRRARGACRGGRRPAAVAAGAAAGFVADDRR